MNKISNERVFDELKKILKLKNIYKLFLNIYSKDIIINIFPQFKYYERLKIFNNLEKNLQKKYDNDLILGLIILDNTNDYEYFCQKFKTSNDLKNRFKNISVNFKILQSKKFYSKDNIKKLIYLNNRENVKDLLLFSICLNSKIDKKYMEELLHYVDNCKIPKFPISGEYLKQRGYKTGINLGKKLKFLEEKWIENNFIIEKKVIERSLNNKNS